jgi:hypothetical protein
LELAIAVNVVPSLLSAHWKSNLPVAVMSVPLESLTVADTLDPLVVAVRVAVFAAAFTVPVTAD